MSTVKNRMYVLVIICVALFYCPAYAQESTVALTADDIMRIVVENMNKNELIKSKLVSFERKHIEYELYRDGKQKSILKNETSYHGESYPPRSRNNNGGISINLNAILSLSYNYTFLNPNSPNYVNLPPEYKFSCDECYIIKFEPKRVPPDMTKIAAPGASATEIGIQETATRMEGVIFVDKLHLFIRKYAGELGQSIDKGPLSSVKIVMAFLDIEQSIRPDLNNIVVLKSAEIRYQIRVGWLSYRTRRDTWQWANYRLNQETPPGN